MLILLEIFAKYFPEPCCFMPITSPFRLKFLKFFQIRYLESHNLFTMPGSPNVWLRKLYRDSFLNYRSWNLGTELIRKPDEPPLESWTGEAGSWKLSAELLNSCRSGWRKFDSVNYDKSTLAALKWWTQILRFCKIQVESITIIRQWLRLQDYGYRKIGLGHRATERP